MTLFEEVIQKLRTGADRSEHGEPLRFSERYAMREAAQLLTALEAQNARMRAIVEAVANRSGRLSCSFECNINERWNEQFPDRWGVHGPNCLVTKARAILAETKPPTTPSA